MPLPKINTPTYELVFPSNNKKIKYRPFLVREEKILIIALESQDMKQITDAIIEILNACVMTKGVEITRSLVGNYCTSLEMQGASITLLKCDEEIAKHWDSPVHTAAMRWGM